MALFVVCVCVLVHVSNQSRDSWRILLGWTNHDLVASKICVSSVYHQYLHTVFSTHKVN